MLIVRICKKIFNFLASLKLAVIVILGFAYVLAMGTIYESLYGTPVAKEKVYGTIWFSLLLLLLGINVLCAALSRLPWKKHHIGFVVTHAGIITILIGSFITQKYGIDGTMALAEGEVGDRVVTSDPLLQVAIPDLGLVETWNAQYKEKSNDESTQPQRGVEGVAPTAPRSGPLGLPMEGATQAPVINKSIVWSKKLKDHSRLIVDQYYPHSESSLKVQEGNAESNPALKITLSQLPFSSGEMSEWVFEKVSDLVPNTVQIGPAKISFVSLESLEKLKSEAPESAPSEKMGKIELTLPGGRTVGFSAEKALQAELPLEGTNLKIKGLRYLPDAVVRDNKLVTRSELPNNPAYEFEIHGPDFNELHIVFARFPDLEGVHGKQEKSGIKAIYKKESNMPSMGKAELYLAIEDDVIFYRIRSKAGLTEISKTKVGETHPTGWMTIQFKIDEYVSKALPQFQYRNVKLAKGQKEGPPPAIHVVIQKEGKEASSWMQQGDMKVLTVEGNPYVVRYGLKSYPVGFQVKLDKFQVLRYPGTENPSSFESFVTVSNPKDNAKFETKIYMNNPLKYGGYTFFQSSYQENPGQPTISIFSVARDPGTPVKYAGSILLVSGIALMFWFKPLFVQKKMTKKET